MFRWAVDTSGLDIKSDLERSRITCLPKQYLECAHERQPSMLTFTSVNPLQPENLQVHVLTPDELYHLYEAKESSPQSIPHSATDSDNEYPQDSSNPVPIRFFCKFLDPDQPIAPFFDIMPPSTAPRGVELVAAGINAFIASDHELQKKYSKNPRGYQLYMADESGRNIIALQLDMICTGITLLALVPLPQAQLELFPNQKELLPPCADDITLIVELHNPSNKLINQSVLVPADMLVENLESTITTLLPTCGIVQGSLRIRFGPLVLNINEYYNFGPGCGEVDVPIAERTIYSLYRFGVTHVVVQGRQVEVKPRLPQTTSSLPEIGSEEDIIQHRQFDIMKLNRNGGRQQRGLVINEEGISFIRPGGEGTSAGSEKPDRTIEDISQIHLIEDRPNYFEIEYHKHLKYDCDRVECIHPEERAYIVKRLNMLLAMQEQKGKTKNPKSRFAWLWRNMGFTQ